MVLPMTGHYTHRRAAHAKMTLEYSNMKHIELHIRIWYFWSYYQMLSHADRIVFMYSFYLPLRCCFLKFHEEAWGKQLSLKSLNASIYNTYNSRSLLINPSMCDTLAQSRWCFKKKKQQMWLQLPGRWITSIPCAIKQKQDGNGASGEGGVQQASEWMFTDANMFRSRSTITNPSDSPSICCRGNPHHPSVLLVFLQNWHKHLYQ